MIRIVSMFTFALVAVLSCTGCGSSTSRTAEQKQAQPTNEVAATKPVTPAAPIAQETPVLGVSAPYQVGEPKGGCKMIVIYDKGGNVHTVASCDSDKNGNVLAVKPLKMSPNAAELFLQP